MNGLQQLINQLCPNGVEWKTLGKVLKYEQPSKYIVESTDYSNEGTPVLTAGASFILGYTDEVNGIYQASKDFPVIIFDDFTTSFHWVDFDFKVKSSAMKMLKPIDGNVNFRYVYYTMCTINYVPTEHTRQWIGTYSNFQIPLPPLAIQSRIVEILDHFTDLTANLTAELNLRRKQFEHYREKLLSLDGVDGVEWKTLGEVAEYSKSRIESKELNNDNYVSVENLLQNKKGKVKSECCPVTGNWIKFVVGDVLIGNIRPYLRKIWLADSIGGTNGDVLAIHIKNRKELYPEYLYYALSSEDFFIYDTDNSKGAKMPRGDKKAILAYTIPVPPLAVQHSIVEKLDKFTALIQNLENELALRQKQYEYYREKLLSFPSPSL